MNQALPKFQQHQYVKHRKNKVIFDEVVLTNEHVPSKASET